MESKDTYVYWPVIYSRRPLVDDLASALQSVAGTGVSLEIDPTERPTLPSSSNGYARTRQMAAQVTLRLRLLPTAHIPRCFSPSHHQLRR